MSEDQHRSRQRHESSSSRGGKDDDDEKRRRKKRDSGGCVRDDGRDRPRGRSPKSRSSDWVDDHRHPSSSKSGRSSQSSSRTSSHLHSRRDRDSTRSSSSRDERGGRSGRSSRPSAEGHSRSRDHRDHRRDDDRGRRRDRYERSRSSSRDGGREGRTRSMSSGYGSDTGGAGGGAGRKRRRDETGHRPGDRSREGKSSRPSSSSTSQRRTDKGSRGGGGSDKQKQNPTRRCQSYELLSDPDYIAVVCGKAVHGEATRSVLAALLDAMGMEILQYQFSPSNDDGNKTTSKDALDATNFSVRPMKKKSVQTPGTVRDFALLQISMMNVGGAGIADGGEKKDGAAGAGAGNGSTVLDEVLAAFRLAAHHVLLYVDQMFGDGSTSALSADKKQKIADFARRALMTCFVSLRGLLLRLSEQADSDRNQGDEIQPGSVRSLFGGEGVEKRGVNKGSLSTAEGVLLDIVPLLTQFFHPPLGEKHALSLLQNLLSLDETARRKKRSSKAEKMRQHSQQNRTDAHTTSAAGHAHTVIVRDGLIELFVRQLCEQEGEEGRKLRKQLLNITTSGAPSDSDVGAVASLQPELTPLCLNVYDTVEEHRRSHISALERKQRLDEAKSGPSWDHEFGHGTKRRRVRQRSRGPNDNQEGLRLLRVDGCIYLSKIAAQILSTRSKVATSKAEGGNDAPESTVMTDTTSNDKVKSPTPSSPRREGVEQGEVSIGESESNRDTALSSRSAASLSNASYEQERLTGDDVQSQRERICRLAYFLFHTLMETYIHVDAHGSNDTIGLRREDIPSAALACYLLAGKMEECPVKVKTLLKIVKNVSLPPPPFTRIQKCCKRLQEMKESSGSNLQNMSLEWGRPSPEVMKQYELKLLSLLGFDFSFGSCDHPTVFLTELCKSLSLDADAVAHVQSVMNDPCYTHSSLCLLGEPKLVATAIYYLSCDKSDRNLHDNWEDLLDEEEGLTKLVADYAWEVRTCVKTREKQWESFRALKARFDASRRSKQSSLQSPSVPDMVARGNHIQPDSNGAKPLAANADLEQELDESSFEYHAFPRPLSSLVDSVNHYLMVADTGDNREDDTIVISTISDTNDEDDIVMKEEAKVKEENADSYQINANSDATASSMDQASTPVQKSDNTSIEIPRNLERKSYDRKMEALSSLVKKSEELDVIATTNAASASISQSDNDATTNDDEAGKFDSDAEDASDDVTKEIRKEKGGNESCSLRTENEVEKGLHHSDTEDFTALMGSRNDTDTVAAEEQASPTNTPVVPKVEEDAKIGQGLTFLEDGASETEDVAVSDYDEKDDAPTPSDGHTQKSKAPDDLNDDLAKAAKSDDSGDVPLSKATTAQCAPLLIASAVDAPTTASPTAMDPSIVKAESEAPADHRQELPVAVGEPKTEVIGAKAHTVPASSADGPSRPVHMLKKQASAEDVEVAVTAAEVAARKAILALSPPKSDSSSVKANGDVDAAARTPSSTTASPVAATLLSSSTPAIMSEEARSFQDGHEMEKITQKSTTEASAASKISMPSIPIFSHQGVKEEKEEKEMSTATPQPKRLLKMPSSKEGVNVVKDNVGEKFAAPAAPKAKVLKMPTSTRANISKDNNAGKPAPSAAPKARMLKMPSSRTKISDDNNAGKPAPSAAPRAKMSKMPTSRANALSLPAFERVADPTSAAPEQIQCVKDTKDNAANKPVAEKSKKVSPSSKRKRSRKEASASGKDVQGRRVKVTFGEAAFGSMLNHLCPGVARAGARAAEESTAEPTRCRSPRSKSKTKRGRNNSESPSASQSSQGEGTNKNKKSNAASRKKRRKK